MRRRAFGGAWRRGARRLRYVVAVLLLVLLAGPAAEGIPRTPQGPRRLDAVAAAEPSPRELRAVDHAYQAGWSWRRRVRVHAVATATATCEGCQGTAWTVQVGDVRRARTVRAANVATAWSSCRECGGDVVSVQVLLVRPAVRLNVDNRALALNAGCDRCRTSARAFQVVATGRRGWVDLVALRDGLASAVRDGGSDDDVLGRLERLTVRIGGGRVVTGGGLTRHGG